MKRMPIILVLQILALLSTSQSNANGNPSTFWNDYPACERQCHQDVYSNQSCTLPNDCACSGGCLCLNDDCLCATPSWLIAVSQCVGEQCGSSAVTEAASIASSACGSHGLTLAVNEQSLIQEGLAASSTTGTSSTSSASPSLQTSEPTSTSTQTQPTSLAISESQAGSTSPSASAQTQTVSSTSVVAQPNHNDSINAKNKMGLIAGLVVGGFILVCGLLGMLYLWKKWKREEAKMRRREDPRDSGDNRSHHALEAKYQNTIASDSTYQNYPTNRSHHALEAKYQNTIASDSTYQNYPTIHDWLDRERPESPGNTRSESNFWGSARG